ncbi:Fe-S cluster assembly sulfur transfer protein SufU [Ilumatobacter nonamiensis]|uniref:Fe-S cluster assembly sulfur transfer protein SufU n=1 Tax=Ilumatobacter nonamiensis TaxID=467093 RepID=UPI00034CB872|nr:SUF system NifU family Fe-S cluster assembly protein [Ilumatobacter nonamiensis]
MSGLEDLYREIILDHYRTPRNRGELDTPPATKVDGHNPLCGDEISVYLMVEDAENGDDAIVTDIKIGGQGCSISQSSASMMTNAVIGKRVGDVRAVSRKFKSLMGIENVDLQAGDDEVDLEDLEALQGVVKFPVRIKCAVLGWNTLSSALDEALDPAE